jgi:hypothetical protein
MRLTRIRFATRWLLVAVAVIAVAIAIPLEMRRHDLKSKAAVHARLSSEYTRLQGHQPHWWVRDWLIQKVAYHDMLRTEYERAATRPWMRTPPEPNEPVAPLPVPPDVVMAVEVSPNFQGANPANAVNARELSNQPR